MRLFNFGLAAFLCCLGPTSAQQQEQIVLSEGSLDKAIRPINIAIIGAGAGGASSAYHLRRFAASFGLPVNITLFERNAYVGGRSTTVDVYDDPNLAAELGASIFVEINKILKDAVREFNLSTTSFKLERTVPGSSLAVWDGKSIVYAREGRGGFWDRIKMTWKYWLSPVKTVNLTKKVIDSFLTLYNEPEFPFESLTKAADAAGLLVVANVTGEQFLQDNEITGRFGPEIVQASTRVNYAQNLKHIHGLEAMVCMAVQNPMAIVGGNWRIFDGMIKASNAATKLETKVTGLEKLKGGSYALEFENADDGREKSSQSFDSVILAAPFQFADIASSTLLENTPEKIPYVELHVTLLATPHLLSPLYFNVKAGSPAPRVVLTTLPPDEEPKGGVESVGSPGFFSVSLVDTLTNPKTNEPEYLYKIFSPSPANSTLISQLFGLSNAEAEVDIGGKDITWIHRKVWNSYPYEIPRNSFEKIQLDENLWYTSGMDSFISTMETNALMGMNVARLVVDHWKKRIGELSANGEMKISDLFPGSGAV